MGIRTIAHEESLRAVRAEIVYTRARLEADPRTRALVAAWVPLVGRQADVAAAQQAAWDEEIIAQAAVDHCDESLDAVGDELAQDLLRDASGDRTAPRFRRYFAKAPNEILRLGLESELAKMREWPASLAGEPSAAVKAHAEPLARAIEEGDAALARRRKAFAASADQRVTGTLRFIDDVNGARADLYAKLLAIGVEHGLDTSWADRFFRRAARSGKRKRAQE